MTNIRPGTRIRLVKAVDQGFDGFYDVGETGMFDCVDSKGAHWIALDKHHPPLNEWNNRLQIWDYSEQGPEFHPSTFYVVAE